MSLMFKLLSWLSFIPANLTSHLLNPPMFVLSVCVLSPLQSWRRMSRPSPLPPSPPAPTPAPRGSKWRTLPGRRPVSWEIMVTTSTVPRRDLLPPHLAPTSTQCTAPTTRPRLAHGSRRWCGRPTARAASADLPPPHPPPPRPAAA